MINIYIQSKALVQLWLKFLDKNHLVLVYLKKVLLHNIIHRGFRMKNDYPN